MATDGTAHSVKPRTQQPQSTLHNALRCELIGDAAERIVVRLEQLVGRGCTWRCTTERTVDDVLAQFSPVNDVTPATNSSLK